MTTRWMPALLMVAIGLPGWAHSHSQAQGHFSIMAHQVAQTLSGDGIATQDEQVSLLANVVATEPSPALEVLSIDQLVDRSSGKRRESRSLVKLGCRLPGTCLPFYSIVSRPEADSAAGVTNVAPAIRSAALKPNSGIVIRAGAHATLVMDDARSHVEVTVVSLENGIAGHTIHVASPDHKQIYIAEVISANLLKRSF